MNYSVDKRLKGPYGRIKDRINDPYNENSMYRDSLKVLQSFASNQEFDLGEVLVSLTSLSRWYGATGVIEILSGKTNESLCASFWGDFLYNTIMRLSFLEEQTSQEKLLPSIKERKKLNPRISFNDQGLLVAKAFALGLKDIAETLSRNTVMGLRDGLFYGVGHTRLTPFVLQTYAKWKNVDVTSKEELFLESDAYRELLRNLTSDPEEIKQSLIDSCDFHLSRSKENNSRETYEFAEPVYSFFPVEILMILRVRQLMGLTNPEVEHPLLKSPLGVLPANTCAMDAFHSSILTRILNMFPETDA